METESFKVLSQRVLQGNLAGNRTETTSFPAQENRKLETLEEEPFPWDISMADIEAELGSDPDWDTLKSDQQFLIGWARSLAIKKQRHAGIVPDGWTGVFKCDQCGLVYLEPGGPYHLQACPWCFNRALGLPIPHPTEDRDLGDGHHNGA